MSKKKAIRVSGMIKKTPSNRTDPVDFEIIIMPKKKLRSAYWTFFGFPGKFDGTVITEDKIVCKLCRSQISYNRNTTNLRAHLEARHKNALKDARIEIHGKQKKSETTPIRKTKRVSYTKTEYDHYSDPCANVEVLQFNENGEMITTGTPLQSIQCRPNTSIVTNVLRAQEETGKIFANFIITDLHPPDIVEREGFRNLAMTLDPNIDIPSKELLTNVILARMYKEGKEEVTHTLSKCADFVSLGIEEWEHGHGYTFFSVYAYYREPSSANVTQRLLGLLENEQYGFAGAIDKVIENWKISPSAVQFVLLSSDSQELKSVLVERKIVTIPCLDYVMQNLSQQLWSDVSELLSKCESIVAYLDEIDNLPGISENSDYSETDAPFTEHIPSIWQTTYGMFRSISLRKNKVISFIVERKLGITLQPEEWSVMKDIVDVLEPFELIVSSLYEESNSSISVIKPIMSQVETSYFEVSDNDTEFAQVLKLKLRDAMLGSYEDPEVDKVLKIASAFDPRFKHLTSEETQDILAKMIENEIEKNGLMEEKEVKPEPKSSNPRSSTFYGLLSKIKYKERPKLSPADHAAEELKKYWAEEGIGLEENPHVWWSKDGCTKFPNIAPLAMSYISTPSMARFVPKDSLKKKVFYHQKRAVLSPDIVDVLLFLNGLRDNNNSDHAGMMLL